MDKRTIKYCGHQGDVGIRRIYQLDDKNYYVRHYDRKTRKFGDKLYASAAQMKTLLSKGKKIVPDAKGFVTLIEGEDSGHHHGFDKSAAAVAYEIDSPRKEQRVFLTEVADTTEFKHWHVQKGEYTKDHASIELPAGLWEMRSQTEQDLNGRLKRVTD